MGLKAKSYRRLAVCVHYTDCCLIMGRGEGYHGAREAVARSVAVSFRVDLTDHV